MEMAKKFGLEFLPPPGASTGDFANDQAF